MKLPVLFCLMVVVVVGAHALTQAQHDKLRRYGEECVKITGVSQESLEKARNRQHVDDPKIKEQALCLLKKMGFMSDDGELQVDTVRSKLKETVQDDQEVEEIVKECTVKKDTPQETAAHTLGCIFSKRRND